MDRFAIFVTVRIKPGMAGAFVPHILKNAEAARRDEPGCLSFHVSRSQDDDHTFHFHEVYVNEAALEAHRATPHFRAYQAAAGHMIAERDVKFLTVLAR